MRTALLAAMKTSPTGQRRADLALAGRTVLARQVGAALALGCKRVIVLADATTAALAEAERECRRHSASFHLLARFVGLSALVHGDDELIVIADGLLPDETVLEALITPKEPAAPLRRVVLCLPDDDPQAADFPHDFERIDAARCWAGVAVMRGLLVQQLVDFPEDSDAISLLLRLALQAGTPCHTLTPLERSPQALLLMRDPAGATARESSLINEHASAAPGEPPSAWLAAWLARQLTARLGAAALPRAQIATLGVGAAFWLGATFSAALGHAAAALLLAALALIAGRTAAALSRLASGLLGTAPNQRHAAMISLAGDALAAFALALALADPSAPLALASLGVIAVMSLRIAEASADIRLAPIWSERAGQMVLLAIAAAGGMLGEAAGLLAIAALGQALYTASRHTIPN